MRSTNSDYQLSLVIITMIAMKGDSIIIVITLILIIIPSLEA